MTWLKVSRCTRTGEISRERKGMDIRFYGWCSNNCSPGSVVLEGLASLERQSPSSPQSMLSSSMTSRSLVLKLKVKIVHNLTKSSLSRRCCNLPQCQHVPMSCHPTQRLVFFHVSGLLNIWNGAMLNMIFLRHRTSQGLWPRRRGKTRWQFFLFRDCHSLFSNNFLSILISTIFRWSTWRISCSRSECSFEGKTPCSLNISHVNWTILFPRRFIKATIPWFHCRSKPVLCIYPFPVLA